MHEGCLVGYSAAEPDGGLQLWKMRCAQHGSAILFAGSGRPVGYHGHFVRAASTATAGRTATWISSCTSWSASRGWQMRRQVARGRETKDSVFALFL